MTMRDKIAQTVSSGAKWRDKGEFVLADAILAALPDMIAPLVWVENVDQGEGGEVALSSIGHVFHAMTDGWSLHRSLDWNDAIDLETAKAAANAHHRAAIMSAFTQ